MHQEESPRQYPRSVGRPFPFGQQPKFIHIPPPKSTEAKAATQRHVEEMARTLNAQQVLAGQPISKSLVEQATDLDERIRQNEQRVTHHTSSLQEEDLPFGIQPSPTKGISPLAEHCCAKREEFPFADFSLPTNARDISCEQWREYKIGRDEWYRINSPVALIAGSTTHRIVDKYGTVHCIPSDTVIRWQSSDLTQPIKF